MSRTKHGKLLKYRNKQTGSSIDIIDMKLFALGPGKRLSRRKRIYYEYRKNRSDRRNSKI